MPHLVYNSISRKTFIKKSLNAAGFLILPNLGGNYYILKNKEEELNLALLSDTHIAADKENNYRGFYPFKI